MSAILYFGLGGWLLYCLRLDAISSYIIPQLSLKSHKAQS